MRILLAIAAGAAILTGCARGGVALGPSHEKIVRVAPHFASRPVRGEIALRAPGAVLHLAVAADAKTLTHGLSDRRSLPAHTGMLFVAPWTGDHLLLMWMKDTYVPIDMIFISDDGVVTSVAADVPAAGPTSPDFRIARRFGRGHYVIELPASEASRDGITTGTHLAIPRAVASL